MNERPFAPLKKWSYVDKDSGQLRTIDVKAEKPLSELENGRDVKVRPSLVLLIECKQSQMPYVFFLSRHPIRVSRCPLFAGLHTEEIAIKTNDDLSTYNVGILGALGLQFRPFLIDDPEFCTSFAKCARKSKEIELSGSDAFVSLVSPLVKALQHFYTAVKPPTTALYFDLYLTLAVAVIDAPMVGIHVQEGSYKLLFLPWVRTVRHEYVEGAHWLDRGRSFAVDIVHKDFLQTYVENHVLSFAAEFSGLAIKHDKVLASGKGFVRGMNEKPYVELEKRLKPR